MTASSALIAELLSQVEYFQQRALQQVMQEATAAYWLRRANDFEAVKPRPGDFTGEAMLRELRDQWRRAHETAKACRNRATVALVEDWHTEIDGLIEDGDVWWSENHLRPDDEIEPGVVV